MELALLSMSSPPSQKAQIPFGGFADQNWMCNAIEYLQILKGDFKYQVPT
jgi:hypothetical protein